MPAALALAVLSIMEKYLIRPKPKATTVVAGTASNPSTSSTCTGSEVQTTKRKKKPVKNEATIKSWQLDWLEVEKAKGDAPALTAPHSRHSAKHAVSFATPSPAV